VKDISDSRRQENDPLSISEISQYIRKAFDEALCNSPTGHLRPEDLEYHEICHYILQYYGQRPFKCKYPHCEYWQHGFQMRSRRDEHERSHDKPLKCHVDGCAFGQVGFLSEKMRQRHLKCAHQSHLSQLGLNTQSLAQGEVEAMLSDLVPQDQVEAVKKVLSAFPDSLLENQTQNLVLSAAFSASSNMLELFWESAKNDDEERFRFSNEFSVHASYIMSSIQGHNKGTLMYILDRSSPCFTEEHKSLRRLGYQEQIKLTSKLVSSDWLEGAKIWSKWIRKMKNESKETPKYDREAMNPTSKGTVISVASGPAAEQQLLYLWRNSGAISNPEGVLSRLLRAVARHRPSVTLARYLLEEGARINARASTTHPTALHYAARHTSAEAAELMRFFLLNGADPEADQAATQDNGRLPRPKSKIRDEKGAKGIHRWLGKTWDELVEETEQVMRDNKAGRLLVSRANDSEKTRILD
jgi:hypothetical protein